MPPRDRAIDAFAIYSIKNERIPEEITGLKLRPGQLRELLENLPAVLVDPNNPSPVVVDRIIDPVTGDWSAYKSNQLSIDYNEGVDGISESPYHLEPPSESHKRSYVIEHQDFLQPWQDEYGNTYGAVTLKGNNFSHPQIMRHANASTGYIPYGLQESYIIERVLRASDIMRAAEISTEYIIGLAQPKRLPWPALREKDDQGTWKANRYEGHVMLGLDEYKRRLVHEAWMGFLEEERTVDTLIDLTEKFKDMQFYTTARAMDTEYRISDLADPIARREVFMTFNRRYRHDTDIDELSSDKTADIDTYFDEFLMPMLGIHFAKLHAMGLAHRFASAMNMTALGGLVDLDSVHGEPLGLGDELITHEDRVYDLVNVISDTWQQYLAMRLCGSELDIDDMPKNCIMQFLVQYFDKTIKHFDDMEKAKDYMGGLMMELEWTKFDANHMEGQIKPFIQEAMASCYFMFFHQYSLLEPKEDAIEALTAVRETFNTPEMRSIIGAKLVEEVQRQRQAIMLMLQKDIVSQHVIGDKFDVVQLLFGSESVEAQLMRMSILEEISRSVLSDALGKVYKEQAIKMGLYDREISLLWQFFQSVHQEFVFSAIAKMTEMLPRGPLVDVYGEIGPEMGYMMPEDILKNDKPLRTGIFGVYEGLSFAQDKLWILNHDVPLYELDDLIKEDIHIREAYADPEDGDEKNKSGNLLKTYSIRSSQGDGYYVTQVVTDGKLQQLMQGREDTLKIDVMFSYDDRPTYVLIVEQNDEGQRRATKVYDSSRLSEVVGHFASMVNLDRAENGELFSVDQLTDAT